MAKKEAKKTKPAKDDAAKTDAQESVVFRPVAQYVKDVSTECLIPPVGDAAISGVNLDMGVAASKEARDGLYEVMLKIRVEGKAADKESSAYLVEVEYAGMFEAKGLSEPQLHAVLHIDAPALLYPFVRNLIMTLIGQTGYKPVMLEPVNFGGMYAHAQKQNAAEAAAKEAVN